MPNTKRKSKKSSASNFLALPCRARPNEAKLIRKGAELTTRGIQTAFIIGAAVAAARAAIAAAGLSEKDVLAEIGDGAKKLA